MFPLDALAGTGDSPAMNRSARAENHRKQPPGGWLLAGGLRRLRAMAGLGVVLVACVASAVHGQGQLLKNAIGPASAGQPAAEEPQQTRERLEGWLREARESLARIDASGYAASLPSGVTASELDEWRRDLEQIIPTITRALKGLNSAAEARKVLENARAADEAWQGFKEEPPFSLLKVDELLNERDAIKAKLTSQKAALANFEHLQASTLSGAKAIEDALNSQLVTLQNAKGDAAAPAKWRVDAARAKSRLQALRAGALENAIAASKELLAAAERELALVDRKIATARTQTRFNEEDLAKVRSTIDGRKKALQKEIAEVSKRLNSAISARS